MQKTGLSKNGAKSGRAWSVGARGGHRDRPKAKVKHHSAQHRQSEPHTKSTGNRQAKSVTAPRYLVIGRNPSIEATRHCHSRVLCIYSALSEERLPEEVRVLKIEKGIPIVPVSFDELTSMASSDAHQGLGLEMAERPRTELKELLSCLDSCQEALILILDSIEDPHNLGSILRAAECFGVEAVLWSKNRGVTITSSAIKASAGASELVTCIEVANINDAITKLHSHGWWVLGAAVEPHATAISEYVGPRKVALVLGNEGKGLHRLTKDLVDQVVMIPLKGKVDSLNVGQAAAILLSRLSSHISGEGRS